MLLAGRAIGCRTSQLLVEWTNTFSVYLVSKGEENLLPYILIVKKRQTKGCDVWEVNKFRGNGTK